MFLELSVSWCRESDDASHWGIWCFLFAIFRQAASLATFSANCWLLSVTSQAFHIFGCRCTNNKACFFCCRPQDISAYFNSFFYIYFSFSISIMHCFTAPRSKCAAFFFSDVYGCMFKAAIFRWCLRGSLKPLALWAVWQFEISWALVIFLLVIWVSSLNLFCWWRGCKLLAQSAMSWGKMSRSTICIGADRGIW